MKNKLIPIELQSRNLKYSIKFISIPIGEPLKIYTKHIQKRFNFKKVIWFNTTKVVEHSNGHLLLLRTGYRGVKEIIIIHGNELEDSKYRHAKRYDATVIFRVLKLKSILT